LSKSTKTSDIACEWFWKTLNVVSNLMYEKVCMIELIWSNRKDVLF
jgi:hypothetical protein